LGQFIDYAVCTGQEPMSTLGYGTLPASFVAGDFADIGAINGATEPPPPTSANCPNPNVP
jgi:hypothetical protein